MWRRKVEKMRQPSRRNRMERWGVENKKARKEGVRRKRKARKRKASSEKEGK